VALVVCVDGSVLEIRPVPVRARDDVAFEVTLQLLVDGAPFGRVGERCGWFLAGAAARLRASRVGGGPPTSTLESGVRRWAMRSGADPDRTWEEMQRYLPRDRELLSFRARDPDDLAVPGELRIELRSERTWEPEDRAGTGRGRWTATENAVLDAWGGDGRGVRAVLSGDDLLDLLEQLVRDVAAAGAAADRRAVPRPPAERDVAAAVDPFPGPAPVADAEPASTCARRQPPGAG
jgi:hypothetical protein